MRFIDKIKPILDALMINGFYISHDIYDMVLFQAAER